MIGYIEYIATSLLDIVTNGRYVLQYSYLLIYFKRWA